MVNRQEAPGVDTPTLLGPSAPPRNALVADSTGHGTKRLQSSERPKDEAPQWLLPGGRLNQYELIRELGRGGMGTVWLARDERLGRRVAIKFLSLPDPAYRDRFLIEARATAQCQHDNIVVIHEVNDHQGHPFMVLEFLEGRPLSGVMDGGIITPPQAIELMIPTLRALVRAHAERLVHRDLKPDNIFVTAGGTVKVLDFGIAKLFLEVAEGDASHPVTKTSLEDVYSTLSSGGLVGTLPYMSPEQWGLAPVDHRTDIWAIGVILFEMVTGRHPVQPLSGANLLAQIGNIEPFASVRSVRSDLPDGLVTIIDRCLSKRAGERYDSAQALLDALLEMSPVARRLSLRASESPYPGLVAFQEQDALWFFGRTAETHQALAALEEHSLLSVVGPSGVGKSSFVRAGVVPALKSRGQDWEALTLRPGRRPFETLATVLSPLLGSTANHSTHKSLVEEHSDLATRLRNEPGYLGAVLRARSRQRGARYLLFVDQFEELYTLVQDPEVRRAFTQCLSAVADDGSTPLRVVVSMRSDLLDRVGEDSRFQGLVTSGLMLLTAPSRGALREALVEPASLAGFHFENEEMVSEMLNSISDSPGALPLLQFSAAKLWGERDRERKLLSWGAYKSMGGIGGALSRHADDVIASLSPDMRMLARTLFERLVTPERTRALLDMGDVRSLDRDGDASIRLVQQLTGARLLTVRTGDFAEEGTDSTVEIVHESLIANWPMLRRWLDDTEEEADFRRQLSAAAKQWVARGKDRGLLWRGEVLSEAVRFKLRYQGDLTPRESEFLETTLRQSTRSARIRRSLVLGFILFLMAIVGVGSVALVRIQKAEKLAQSRAKEAEEERKRAVLAEAEVKRDKATIAEKLAAIEDANAERERLMREASDLEAMQQLTKRELIEKTREYQVLLREAREEVSRLESVLQRQSLSTPRPIGPNPGQVAKLQAQLETANAEIKRRQARISSLEKEVHDLKLKETRAKVLLGTNAEVRAHAN